MLLWRAWFCMWTHFGSLLGMQIMDDPPKLSKIIFEALAATGKRAIIQKGWGKLGEVPGVPVSPPGVSFHTRLNTVLTTVRC